MLLKLGSVLLGKGPALALTLTDSEALRSVQKAKREGARVLEIRIDRFRKIDEAHVLQRIRSLRSLRLPLIATLRSRKEGGGRSISDSKRLSIFEKALPFVDAIDLELGSVRLRKTLVPLARRKGKRIILSYHNFKATPTNRVMLGLIRRGKRGGADLVKLAVTPQKAGDLARLLLLTHRNREKHLVSIAMGRLGLVSRVLAPLFGSLLTYSFVGRPQAPGQLSIERTLKEMKAFQGALHPSSSQ